MENNTEKESGEKPKAELSDIESRIGFLKKKAAEADFLREERDMLIDIVKLYNPDYKWPESDALVRFDMPNSDELKVIKEKIDKLQLDNEQLVADNQNISTGIFSLKLDIDSLQRNLKLVEKNCRDKNLMEEENTELKKKLTDVIILKEENEQLLKEQKQLNEDFEKLLLVTDPNDPLKGYKAQIGSLHFRINSIVNRNREMEDAQNAKDVEIKILNEQISQLNDKLNDPYTAAKIKISMGLELTDKEAYLLAMNDLERSSKRMFGDINMITEQLNLVTEKYTDIENKLKLMDPKYIDIIRSTLIEDKQRSTDEFKSKMWGVIDDDDDELNYVSERGSTAHVSRDQSVESMFHDITPKNTDLKLALLAENTRYMEAIHNKIAEIREHVLENDISRFTEELPFIPLRNNSILEQMVEYTRMTYNETAEK